MVSESELLRVNSERRKNGLPALSMFEARRVLQLSNIDEMYWDQELVDKILFNIVMSELIPSNYDPTPSEVE